jgi:hypothetical protein
MNGGEKNSELLPRSHKSGEDGGFGGQELWGSLCIASTGFPTMDLQGLVSKQGIGAARTQQRLKQRNGPDSE